MSGCGDPKTVSHLFLHCHCFGSLWHLVRNWLEIYRADPTDISNHFIQFGNIAGGSKARRSIMHLIWLSCTWEIWKQRNNMIFNNMDCSTVQILEKIKSHSFWWLKANKKGNHA